MTHMESIFNFIEIYLKNFVGTIDKI